MNTSFWLLFSLSSLVESGYLFPRFVLERPLVCEVLEWLCEVLQWLPPTESEWNRLPQSVGSQHTTTGSSSQLKIYLFRLAYPLP